MKEHGICDRGITPQYYGSLKDIDVQHILPQLEPFLNIKHAPSAIFLKYVPHMQDILPQLYTERRLQNFISGIREIHKALVLHCDENQRSIIVENGPERAIWIDFDRAQTYHAESLGQRQKRSSRWRSWTFANLLENLWVIAVDWQAWWFCLGYWMLILCSGRNITVIEGRYTTPTCTTAPKRSKAWR